MCSSDLPTITASDSNGVSITGNRFRTPNLDIFPTDRTAIQGDTQNNAIETAPTLAPLAPTMQPSGNAIMGIDPDVAELNTFQILSDPSGLFGIVGTNLVTAGAIDAEIGTSYDLELRLTDSAGHSIDRVVTITIQDVNDTAPVLTSASEANVAENTVKVLDLAASDADTTGEATSYAIKAGAGDGALFQLNGSSLEFIKAPDFEDANHGPVYTVTVIATDGVNSSEQTITVTVGDVMSPDTFAGRGLDDQFVYAANWTWDRIDGLAGSDTLTLGAAVLRVGADGGDATFDLGGDGSVDLRAVNVENQIGRAHV